MVNLPPPQNKIFAWVNSKSLTILFAIASVNNVRYKDLPLKRLLIPLCASWGEEILNIKFWIPDISPLITE